MESANKNSFFVSQVKKLMKEKNLNQKDLARLSGITETSVSRYLAELRKPRFDVLINFARALNVDVSELLEPTDSCLSKKPFDDIKLLLARNKKNMTEDEKKEIYEILFGKEEE